MIFLIVLLVVGVWLIAYYVAPKDSTLHAVMQLMAWIAVIGGLAFSWWLWTCSEAYEYFRWY